MAVKDEDKSGVLFAAARVIRKKSNARKEARKLKIPIGVFSKVVKKLKKTAASALDHRHAH